MQNASLSTAAPASGRRLQLIDVARGGAIVGMAVYHLVWDLAYFELIPVDTTTQLAWMALQRAVLGSFLLLVGASLVLGHGEGMRWRAFGKRLALIAGGALAVTAGTYLMFPDYFVYFGILHAIAVFSLLALPFLRAPSWVVAAAIVAVAVPPLFIAGPEFAARPLAWVGFWSVLPETTDIVPIFPWFAVVLTGVLVTRLLRDSRAWPALASWRSNAFAWRALAAAGRWSLVIYLLHQPLLIGALMLYQQVQPAPVLQPAMPSRTESFLASCRSSCATNRSEAYCAAYCDCAVEQMDAEGLWDVMERGDADPAKQEAVAGIARICTRVAE